MKVTNLLKSKRGIIFALFLLAICGHCLADRALEQAEILSIFQQLTQQPRDTWIPAGTIEAKHHEYRAAKTTDPDEINSKISEEVSAYQNNADKPERAEYLQKMRLDATPFNVRYKLSNEYTMDSSEIIKFDGERYRRDITTNSRTDSVKPDKSLAGNEMTDQFSEFNNRRISAWDGEKYSMYSPLAGCSFVDAAGKLPRGLRGPLTAGITPWGHGRYTYDSLAATDSAGVEKVVDGRTQIELAINMDGIEMLFVLDPSKNYAVLSCTVTGHGNSIVSKQFNDYSLVAGNWVPAVIILEKFEAGSNKLLASDVWEIISIDAAAPAIDSFQIDYAENTLVEYASDVSGKSEIYRHSDAVNTDTLLTERLAFSANEGYQTQNCATAALKYAAGKLGRTFSDTELAGLVTENGTSLYAIKALAEQKGLYCRAVSTDIETLKSLTNCQIILYLPSNKHFVAVEGIDSDYVKIIDISSSKFYYQTDLNFFNMDWSTGVALLISNNAIAGQFSDIAAADLQTIVGAGYSCTKLLQEHDDILCTQVFGECGGTYVHYYQRYGCEVGDGSCSYSVLYRRSEIPCIEDPYDPFNCTVTGNWTNYYMRACA
ncbi:MAG: cysteine peptidase family C39 domain-containing protein [Phycisphaerae bacterium]|nr:cysteine peptidase family C39 domain-containing protein [Phycisphaerae bacterium]